MSAVIIQVLCGLHSQGYTVAEQVFEVTLHPSPLLFLECQILTACFQLYQMKID